MQESIVVNNDLYSILVDLTKTSINFLLLLFF